MDEFFNNLKRQIEENPIAALMVGAAVVTAASKFLDSSAGAVSRRAYARQIEYKLMNTPK